MPNEIMIYRPITGTYREIDAEICELISDLVNEGCNFRHLIGDYGRIVHDLMLAGF